ncbi:hypothetical protein XENTR_v10010686 [Xenopus tropicalis]|uniref:E74-like ETS transcription factor 5 n=1 Tax=Xenopus tropicalis TaxID=8364 RepID=F6RHY2_XENTR|nr:ETS-related transcription factor Elf-5 [Xenopus tropicalis]KAE8606344.1 hypothetical protein XENTR_v10010686 [Xenopus tropicalis]KAE8606345.1 hypothetical protein XENTR_v10010686 [Xenopus tropicalis]
MLDSVAHGTIVPTSEPHFWADYFCHDLYPAPREPSPGVPELWTSLLPEHWTKDHVCEWLQYCCDSYKLDANCIPFSHFNVSGLQLCNMTRDDFTEAAGLCGYYLYSLLQEIRTQGFPCHTNTEDRSPPISKQEEKLEVKTEVVKRNRPSTINRPAVHSSHLWEFMRDLLLSPDANDGILEWDDKEQGVFRVVKSEALAQMWGKRKKNERMNYEKLSRALRHYYKTGILERVDRRLVYKFGKNAHGWK